VSDVAPRTLTIAEVAELTGLTPRAIAARIERGTLPSELRGNRRHIPLVALYEQGLMPMDPGATVADLLDRIERLARRIGELEAENRGLEAELRRSRGG